MMFRSALQYPRSGDGALRRTVIGGVLTALSALVLPAIVLGGYYTRVLETTMNDADGRAVPAFSEWWDLLKTGVGFVAVTILYGLVPTVVVAVGTQVSPAIAVLGGVFGLAVYYVLPAALANYARTKTVRGAFDVRTVGDVVFESTYAIGWLQALVLLVVGGAIAGALATIAVGFFVAFYVAVSAFHIYGRAFRAALGPGREPSPTGGVPTA